MLPIDLSERLRNIHVPLWIEVIGGLSFGGLIFGLIAFNDSPAIIGFGLNLRLNVRYVLLMGAMVYVALRFAQGPGRILTLALISAWFALPLAGLWGSGYTHTTILSGLIPVQDASDYYTDALRLISGLDYSSFSARRPLFAGSLAVLLFFTNHNLMTALAILGFFSAVACFLAAIELHKTHGAEAATLMLALLFLFYRTHIGAVMSENIGFSLGVIGFAVIWRGISQGKLPAIGLGLFISTLALNARAGAFLVLPALIIWWAWSFKQPNRWISPKVLALGTTIVISGFLANYLMVKILAVESGVLFGNFSYTLYGLAAGGEGWGHVFTVHPEVDLLEEPEQSNRVYQLAFELMLAHPDGLLTGAIRYWWAFLFSEPWYSAYSFVHFENQAVNLGTHAGLYLLCLVGLAKLFQSPADPFASLLAAATLGIFASVPFAPPSDAYFMRAHAAMIVVLSILPAAGFVFILERLRINIHRSLDPDVPGLGFTGWFGLLIIVPLLLGPLAIQSAGHTPKYVAISCGEGMSSVYLRLDPGAAINVIDTSTDRLHSMLNYEARNFRRSVHGLSDVFLIERLDKLEAPRALFFSLNFATHDKVMIFIPSHELPPPGLLLGLCGTWAVEPGLQRHNVFYAETAEIIGP
jgi:hypothetical protein